MQNNALTSGIEITAGWALDTACDLDQIASGFAGGYLRASARRRQIVHAVLALGASAGAESANDDCDPVGPDDVWALLRDGERDLIAHHWGSCPAGFLGALAKVGHAAQSIRFYGDLFAAFSEPRNTTIARALRHLDTIDEARLAITRLLPPSWRYPGLIIKLTTERKTGKFLRAVELIQQWCPRATDDLLDEAIRRLSRTGTVAAFIASWMRHTKFIDGPIRNSEAIRQIRTGAELEYLGRNMRNCLRDQIGNALVGTSTFYLITTLEVQVVVHFHRDQTGDQWLLEDIYIDRNRPVPANLRRKAEDMLCDHGFDPGQRLQRSWSDAEMIRSYLWDSEIRRAA